MKNFVKVIALATVACMLLSVSAFAAVTPAPETDQITLTVEGATKGEEVAVLVVVAGTDVKGATEDTADDLTDGKIEYIGQVTAGDGNVANFGTFTVKNADAKVDIWVGSTTLSAASGAVKIGENIDLKGVSKITIAEGTEAITATAEGEGGKYGYAAAITATVPEALSIVKAIWAFKVGEDWKYSAPITNHNQTATAGDVQFAAAFNAFTENGDGTFTEVTVSDVAVIFLTGEANADNTHYVAEDAVAAELEADGPYAANN